MGLRACPECNQRVSRRAEACPNCGHPLRRRNVPNGWGCGCGTWIVVLFVALALSNLNRVGRGRSTGSGRGTPTGSRSDSQASADVSRLDALAKMELAFVGSPSRTEIKSKMVGVFRQFSVAATEANYQKYGSILVAVRKDGGATEMEILDCVAALGAEYNRIELHKAMALCAATLAAGHK